MRIGLVSSATLLAFLTLATGASAADWPQWLGPSRHGATSELIAPWKDVPKTLWKRAVGNGYSSPVVADGAVILHSAVAGKDAEEVLALNAKTGEPLWTDVYTRGPYRSQLGVGPRATPTIADGKLF